MALVTVRRVDIRNGLVFVDVTYDDVTERIERVYVECNNPAGAHVVMRKGSTTSIWREAFMTGGEVFDKSRPLGGGINDLADLNGADISLVF